MLKMTVDQSKGSNKDGFKNGGFLRYSIPVEDKIPLGHPFINCNSEKVWPTFANHIQEI